MTNFSHGFKCFHGRLPVPPHGWPLLTGSGMVVWIGEFQPMLSITRWAKFTAGTKPTSITPYALASS